MKKPWCTLHCTRRNAQLAMLIGKRVNVKRKPLQNLPEPTNSIIEKETRMSSNQSKASVRTMFSLARDKEALNSKYKKHNHK